MSVKNSLKHKYLSQSQHHESKVITKSNWQDQTTVDYWRHAQMYKKLDPILQTDKRATWLTVGDGTYGREAHYIIEHGGKATATDLTTKRLRTANQVGYIDKYKKANAEKLPFKSNSYDYVVCKESYHHFPRPTIALYEMIRVSRKAVIIIEPNDVRRRRFSWKRLWGVEEYQADYINRFEVSGNYVYMPTRREIEKIAYGLGLPAIAFSGIEDYYIKGIENEKISDNTINYQKIKLITTLAEYARRLGMRDSSLLSTIIFKTKPTKKTLRFLTEYDYQYHALQSNPYLK